MDAMTIFKDGATAGLLAKVLVDMIKKSPIPSPSTVRPLLALLFSMSCAVLLFMTSTEPFNRQTIAFTICVGLVATGSAVAATMMQTTADRVEERIDVALKLPPDSTKADVNKELAKTDAEPQP